MAPSYSAPSTHPHCCPYREPGHPATSTLSTASCSVRPHSSAARWGVKATTEPIAGTSTLTQYAATDWPASPCLSPWEEPHCQRAAPLAGSREWMEIRSPVLWAWGGIKEAPGWGAVAHGVWGGIWATVLSGYPRQQPLVPAERGRSPARPSIGPPSSCLPAEPSAVSLSSHPLRGQGHLRLWAHMWVLIVTAWSTELWTTEHSSRVPPPSVWLSPH